MKQGRLDDIFYFERQIESVEHLDRCINAVSISMSRGLRTAIKSVPRCQQAQFCVGNNLWDLHVVRVASQRARAFAAVIMVLLDNVRLIIDHVSGFGTSF